MSNIHIVFGPTCSGKTEYATVLAQNFDSVIINGDAMQVYKEIPIITNQPTIEERKNIPHEMFGYKSILQHSDINKWLGNAVDLINRTLAQARTPIIAGGTGMYLRALVDGVSEIPEIPDEYQQKSRNLLKSVGNEKFHQLLSEIDPESSSRLKPGDSQRMTRAYEVMDYTHTSLTEWNRKPNKQFFDRNQFRIHFLDKHREEIYANINRRFKRFIANGALEEALHAQNIFSNSGLSEGELTLLPSYKAHGLRELISYLKGEISLEDAIDKGQQVTRNYAKRQMTWWRGWNKDIKDLIV